MIQDNEDMIEEVKYFLHTVETFNDKVNYYRSRNREQYKKMREDYRDNIEVVLDTSTALYVVMNKLMEEILNEN